jgi:hypothetical protein
VSEPVERPVLRPVSFSLMTLLAFVTVVSVAMGLARIAPGFSFMLGAIAAPALLITAIRANRRRGTSEEFTTDDRVSTFLISAAIMIGIVAIGTVAVALAIVVWGLFGWLCGP